MGCGSGLATGLHYWAIGDLSGHCLGHLFHMEPSEHPLPGLQLHLSCIGMVLGCLISLLSQRADCATTPMTWLVVKAPAPHLSGAALEAERGHQPKFGLLRSASFFTLLG